MFQSARLKLTAWYLLIIMLISIAFSMAIYRMLITELVRVERVQRLRRELQIPFQLRRSVIDPELLQESATRLRATLVLINLAILGMAGVAGYFLAGRTLRPIKVIVDEQNRFITDASHELRTPLTALKTEIEVNLRDQHLGLRQARKLLQSNLEEVNRLQYLSDDLIKLAQFQKSDGRTDFEKIALVEILNEACSKVAGLAKYKNITIRNKAKDAVVKGDKQSLTEVFVILLDNAIKYSPAGKTVDIMSKKQDRSIMISIVDQGIGISQEDLPHIFDRFYRADKSRAKLEVAGYGLGLSIAKQIIEQHNGTIKTESQLDKGTTFFVSLPT